MNPEERIYIGAYGAPVDLDALPLLDEVVTCDVEPDRLPQIFLDCEMGRYFYVRTPQPAAIQWASVEGRMPPNASPVLVWCVDEEGFQSPAVGQWYYLTKQWRLFGGCGEPTHWAWISEPLSGSGRGGV